MKLFRCTEHWIREGLADYAYPHLLNTEKGLEHGALEHAINQAEDLWYGVGDKGEFLFVIGAYQDRIWMASSEAIRPYLREILRRAPEVLSTRPSPLFARLPSNPQMTRLYKLMGFREAGGCLVYVH